MRINDALPKEGSKKRARRVGRGVSAGQGASCGEGMRGQKSRAGGGTRPGFEGGQMPLYRRLPKLKHFPLINHRTFTVVNVKALANLPADSQVDLAFLIDQGIVKGNAKPAPLKILGDGEIQVSLQVKAAAFTASAKQKIEAAGGQCEVIS